MRPRRLSWLMAAVDGQAAWAQFTATIAPVAHVTFAGALDRSKLSMAERLVVKGVHAPDGDFRDWNLIETWAREIAEQLDTRVPVGGSRHGS